MSLFGSLAVAELLPRILFAITVILTIIFIIVALTTDVVKTRIWYLTGSVALLVFGHFLLSMNDESPLSLIMGLFSSDEKKGGMYDELKTEVWNPSEDD